MYKSRLKAVIAEKTHKEISIEYEVMQMKYKVEDNTLWIVDVRGTIMDFDLNEVDVEIKTTN